MDIDQGQVMQIENYKARRDLNILRERNMPTDKPQLGRAQEYLNTVEREFAENPLILPSFFQEISEYEIFEKIRRRDLGLGTIDELEGLAIEAKFRLYDDILMKSPLWVELTENQIKKKKRNWIGNTQG